MPRKLALLIGVGEYRDPKLKRLGAPAADVAAFSTVLRDPAIAAFDEVTPLAEPTRDAVIAAIDELCAARASDDLVLLYFSGHGIRDDRGRLFFGLGSTRYERPRGTGIAASELKSYLDDCHSRRQVLILDCCHAGAFMESERAATEAPALTEDTFEVRGYGREILAATNATAYAFEGDEPKGDGSGPLLGKFTRLLVEGLRAGAGVTDADHVTVTQLFEYARRGLDDPRMRPQHWRERGEAPLVIARNPNTRPRLPPELLVALDDRNDWLRRRGAVDWLDSLLRDDARLREAALAELRRREPDEEHRRVHERMLQVLTANASSPAPTPPGPVNFGRRQASTESDWAPGRVFRDLDAPWCPEMVVVPPGRFVMGSPESEEGRYADEGPLHEVTIAAPLAVGRYPVTFEEYEQFCGQTGRKIPSDGGWGRERRPVINVSWEDPKAYCAWLSQETRKPYRLPSEAEWEYAARGGMTTPFWTGATISTAQANYNGNYAYGLGEKGVYREKTVAVDDPAFPANPFGLYHVLGNAWEWVEDCYHDSYNGAPLDGSAWTTGDCSARVLRGGSWNYVPRNLRAANRGRSGPGVRNLDAEFRVVRALTP